MNRYTYKWIDPNGPPFKKKVRFTLGTFQSITEPCGCFKFRYAVFRNRASELWIPLHDLTPETKTRIGV